MWLIDQLYIELGRRVSYEIFMVDIFQKPWWVFNAFLLNRSYYWATLFKGASKVSYFCDFTRHFVDNLYVRNRRFLKIMKVHKILTPVHNVWTGSKSVVTFGLIKISTHPCYPKNFDWFSWEWKKEKNSKWPTQKNWDFQNRQFSTLFCKKYRDLSLG